MKTKLLIVLLTVGSILIADYNYVQAQNRPFDKQAITMLKEFYLAYFTASSKLPTPVNLRDIEALKKKYCTDKLYSKIKAQYKSGYVEADPFTQSQDINIAWFKNLSFNKDLGKLNNYNVSYMEPYSNEKVTIRLTVIKQGNDFKIASIK